MERITISVSDEFAAELTAFMEREKYGNRSEAVRDLARLGLKQARMSDDNVGQCVATLSYVFNHHARELPKRLTDAHHAHHDLQVAAMHVHLDHEHCLEVAVLRGDAAHVRNFARGVIAERGVMHGEVSIVPASIDHATHHHHDDGPPQHQHTHTRPKS